MRRWAFLVVLLYGVILAALTFPVVYACFGWTAFGFLKAKISSSELEQAARYWKYPWGYWVWIGILMLAEACLLLVPVSLSRGRPVRKRTLVPLLLASGFMAALLTGAFLVSVFTALFGENGKGPLGKLPEVPGSGWGWALLATLLSVWIVWIWVFYRSSRVRDPRDWTASVCRFLLAGSILELLVAVPCHVMVRRREECCADLATFLGIASGVAVMLFSFGPGVLFLYAERVKRLAPKG